MSTEAASVYPSLDGRSIKGTICLFDVDNTLTPARQSVSPEMLQLLSALRHKCAIGFVGGSNLVKQQEQLGTPSILVTGLFDFCFAENGLTAYRLGKELASQSFIGWLGQEKYKQLVNFCLRYIADIECPVKTGTFVEFRCVVMHLAVPAQVDSIDRSIFSTSSPALTLFLVTSKEWHDQRLSSRPQRQHPRA